MCLAAREPVNGRRQSGGVAALLDRSPVVLVTWIVCAFYTAGSATEQIHPIPMPAVRFHSAGRDMARSKSCLSVMLGLAVLVGGGFAAEPAATGQWKEDEVDETQRSEFQSKLGGVLSEGRFRPGEQEAFDDYFTKYFLPRWTVVANRDSLYQYRQELRRRLERATGVVHDHLNDLVLEFGGARVGDGGYYPAARVNFMLAIGDLNAEERAPGGIPPVPLPEALPVLIQAVESDDPAQIDGVRVAALLGILRHLDLGAVTAGDTRQAVGNAALKVLGSPRPAGRSAEGHAWLRMLAAEILGKLGDTGPNGAVATALAGLVAEPAAPFYARCTAAEALGRLDYAGATGLDAWQPPWADLPWMPVPQRPRSRPLRTQRARYPSSLANDSWNESMPPRSD
jgi:hypothetical protein